MGRDVDSRHGDGSLMGVPDIGKGTADEDSSTASEETREEPTKEREERGGELIRRNMVSTDCA